MNIFSWLEHELSFIECDSAEFMYNRMESQSDKSLPIIYQQFDMGSESHWRDRGYILDFYLSTGDGRILDFGPGDGWPSLLIAPFVEHVTGVDSSLKRVETCIENANRLNLKNVDFVHIPAGKPLPFEDDTFDGVTAASSLEQTPDPKAALTELYRVLKPGGRLRMFYESLKQYQDGGEKELISWQTNDGLYRIDLYSRQPEKETAEMYALEFEELSDELLKTMKNMINDDNLSKESIDSLGSFKALVKNARKCTLYHPDGKTWLDLMNEVGFSEAKGTRDGGTLASLMFRTYDIDNRPGNLTDLDEHLAPFIKEIIKIEENSNSNPMITAVK